MATDVNPREIPEVNIALVRIVVVVARRTSARASASLMRSFPFAFTSPKIGSDRILWTSGNEERHPTESLSLDVSTMLEGKEMMLVLAMAVLRSITLD